MKIFIETACIAAIVIFCGFMFYLDASAEIKKEKELMQLASALNDTIDSTTKVYSEKCGYDRVETKDFCRGYSEAAREFVSARDVANVKN